VVKTAQPRNYSSSLVTAQEKHLTQLAAFSPAIAHWELSERDASLPLEASSWELRVALLFVDISGFTNLCTRLDIDCLQRHINTYFTQLIDIVVARGGDVLRFAGDAIFCSWSLAPHADDEDLALATAAVCTPRPPRPPRLRPQRALAPAALPHQPRCIAPGVRSLGDCQHARMLLTTTSRPPSPHPTTAHPRPPPPQACACSLELNRQCAVYPIPEIEAELSIHSGVGAGPVTREVEPRGRRGARGGAGGGVGGRGWGRGVALAGGVVAFSP